MAYKPTPEELITMQAIKDCRNDIKELADAQSELKNNRRTVNFKGNRIMEPNAAAKAVHFSAVSIRHLQIAFAIMRGFDENRCEPNAKVPHNKELVSQMLEAYKIVPVSHC
jgi:hypothetical protein